MIKVKNGEVTIKGSEPELLTDLSMIVKGLNENLDKEMIQVAVDLGLGNIEEVKKLLEGLKGIKEKIEKIKAGEEEEE